LMNISERERSSCITRSISFLSIFRAEQSVIDVAVDTCSAPTLASEFSPTNSLAERRVIVASLPLLEMTGQLCAATLKIENGVGSFSLRKEGLLFA